MGVPNKKLKKLMMITGIALGVYAGFKYLLPLVIPFFLALGLAEGLRPAALWMQKKMSCTWKKKRLELPLGVWGTVLLLGVSLGIGVLFFWAGKKMLQEGRLLLDNLPQFIEEVDRMLSAWCERLELAFQLEKNSAVHIAREMLENLLSYVASRIMPYVMGNSMLWLTAFVHVMIFFVVLFFGTVLALQEGEEIHRYFRQSLFRQEYREMVRILKVVGAAYGKTQLLILMGTIAICTGGLFLMDNPYYGILGVIIGLLDALPFIGTGTVIFPWAALCFVQGNGKKAALLMAIYLLCYLLRQIMESRMMGRDAGLSPFLTLAAVYIGIQLFGIWGVVLGPLYFLILRESIG
ncbi:MAG: AI-2E family transporter [Lachnospiraceae bacterium]|nr:AI-2E family transporter [Lachnospiraceae bacterium]